MKEKGIVIFEDGNVLAFGTYVCPDEDGYFESSTHETDFKNEVVSSTEFKLSDHYYIDEDSLIPYYDENDKKRVSVNKVNQDIMLDPRIPRGIDYQTDGTTLVYVRRKNPQK